MRKNLNLTCVLITLLPIIVLTIFYNSLGHFVNTKISGSNGIILSKENFMIIIPFLSIVWYYGSIFFSQKLILLNRIINQVNLRVVINLILSVLSILLILSNLH